jgi:hypothetical protein
MRLCAQYLLNIEELHRIQQHIESGGDQTFILPVAQKLATTNATLHSQLPMPQPIAYE